MLQAYVAEEGCGEARAVSLVAHTVIPGGVSRRIAPSQTQNSLPSGSATITEGGIDPTIYDWDDRVARISIERL